MKCSKIIKGFDNVNAEDYITFDRSNISRRHTFKITGKKFTSNEAKHFFFNRIVNVWNSLPANVVDSKTITIQSATKILSVNVVNFEQVLSMYLTNEMSIRKTPLVA